MPENPRSWLVTVASRRVLDELRSERARQRREQAAAAQTPSDELFTPGPGRDQAGDEDDTLVLLFLCAHPALSPASQIALTLRAVGGLATAEIAAMVRGPQAGLDLLRTLDGGSVADHHRVHAVRAHLLEMIGDRDAARDSYRAAARRTTSLPEQRYLEARAARLIDDR